MKIAYLIGNFPVLSETFVLNEIIRLKKLGHEITVFSFAGPSAEDLNKFTHDGKRITEKTVYISKKEALIALLFNPIYILRLWNDNTFFQKHAKGKPNIILRMARAIDLMHKLKSGNYTHLHAHWPYACQVAHLASCIAGINYSISVHAHEVAHESGHFPLVMKTTKFAAFCNAGALNYLKRNLSFDISEKAHLVYHGVDINKFPLLPFSQIENSVQIISAGRLTQTKGFDKLIRGCALACSNGISVKLTILGRGALEKDLLKCAEELDFVSNLNMPGWVSQEEVTEHMKASHVFVLMADTGFHDGLPNVVLEAMACGRLVILSPLPAASEAIEHGVNGFILESQNDLNGLVHLLKKIISNSGLVERMGLKARERVTTDHNADVQINRLVDLFKSVNSGN